MARRAIKARWLGKRKGSYAMVQDWLPDSSPGSRRRRKKKTRAEVKKRKLSAKTRRRMRHLGLDPDYAPDRSYYRSSFAKRRAKHKKRRGGHLFTRASARASMRVCARCHRTIFGGPKGMRTHKRRCR